MCRTNRRDHPRVCGEKSQKNLQGQITLGSPPRMRGKAIAARRQPLGLRITPAYAGKSVVPENLDALCKDHPRVCGEKRVRLAFICGIWGSPPRMRGKDKVLEVVPQNTGITPAYAGKSCIIARFCYLVWDHPRVCGEKPALLISPANAARITPAYAGKRSVRMSRFGTNGDHPRVCGEKGKQLVK